ncbi:hypothetical protein I7I50_00520 [Histoplasma capsulatum G186AR]|uniref:Uncharacterized protein n=1 Tax=Ajellomyces capsulatus TaxID=5037 RepID=A0A8H8CUY8_AJECA|nr:hypothetical protein I7I52_07788 [Histoplasma capsulatum]QSS72617.1 hypothetical protein I7I50_00520 [Histoplasma capsulatum G186AR]
MCKRICRDLFHWPYPHCLTSGNANTIYGADSNKVSATLAAQWGNQFKFIFDSKQIYGRSTLGQGHTNFAPSTIYLAISCLRILSSTAFMIYLLVLELSMSALAVPPHSLLTLFDRKLPVTRS